tara:strand:+ start:1019 stop:1165 length:147 start_codon:yes stop_codon:yes gene_type:complete
MQKIKEKLFLGIIFYLSIVALGHLMHGSGDAIRRMAMTRSIIFEGSVL